MSDFEDYARFENRRYVLSDSDSSNEQIISNNCTLCSEYDKSICTFPCWNSFIENKRPGAVIIEGFKKSIIYFFEDIDTEIYSGIIFEDNKKFMLRTARDLLILNPFIIDCYGRPVTSREWLLELDCLDREILLPEKWKGHAEIIKNFERKKITEQKELFAKLSEQ
jgi:hypothetical protein